ncbi:MAG: PfkB family carbohydrate kinase [Sphingomonadaceae bacterium]
MIDYLAIGHLAVDHRLARGPVVGGSVAYASITATRLGQRAGIVTVADEELEWPNALAGVEMRIISTPASTGFENLYRRGKRIQRVLAVAPHVPAEAVPEEWKRCPVVHLAPIVHEVDGSFPGLFTGSLIALTPQGLLRHWDEGGRVRQGAWSGDDRLLAGANVVIFSEEDLAGDPGFLPLCLERVPITLLTHGAKGVTLFTRGQPTHLPAFPTTEVDPTGAGDVFAASFLVEYHRTRDPLRSAAFACCAASFAVERIGLEGVQDRAAVEERLKTYENSGLRTEG